MDDPNLTLPLCGSGDDGSPTGPGLPKQTPEPATGAPDAGPAARPCVPLREYVPPTPEELGLTPPPVVSVTTAWLQEMRRRQAVYAARRARWTDAMQRGAQPEPPTDTDPPNRRRTGIIHDPRQFRFDF